MPLVKDWEAHFKTLTAQQRSKLICAMDDLMTDLMIMENYKYDLSNLKYCLLCSAEQDH